MQSHLHNKYFNHVHRFPRNNYCWMKARCQIRGVKLEKLWPCMYCKKGYLVTFVLLTGLNASCFVQENRLCSCEMPTSKSGNAVVRNMKLQPWRNPCWGDLVQLRQKPQKNDFNGLNSERNEVSASSHGTLVNAFLLLAVFVISVGPFFW